MNVIDYKLITAGDTSELTRKVCQQLAEGWQPHNGHAYNSNGSYYSQAMVKYG